MKRIARFEKVTKEQFCEGYRDCFGEDGDAVYETLTLPRRATAGSAGYDFCTPRAQTLAPGESVKSPSGIRVWMEDGGVL